MKKRILSFALALVLAVSLLPVSVFAAENHDGQVHVTVENTTWTKADGAPWEGTLVDTWVDLKEDSTMMSCITAALDAGDYSYSGADRGYISEINGISQMDASGESGWMGTLNDWFTDEGFANFTVANGKLAAGDEIRVMHTKNGYGKDIGSDWSTVSDTSLSALSFSAGTLSPAFSKDLTAYTLTLTEPTDVKVSATATNKSNQVYLSVGETEYRRTAAIPAEGGTVLTVRCGDSGATTYTVTVRMDVPQAPPARRDGVPAEATAGVSVNKPYTLDLSTIFTDINGDTLTYLVSVNGGAFQTADKDYAYTPAEEGTTTLTFKANDGTADSTDTYTVTLTAYDKVMVTFSGMKTTSMAYLKVYSYADGEKGTANLLDGVDLVKVGNSAYTYTVDLSLGDYWVEGYDKFHNKAGSIVVTVTPETTEFAIRRLRSTITPSSWVYQQDYDFTVEVTSPDGKVTRQVEVGESKTAPSEKVKETPSALFLSGDNVYVKATPIGDKAWEYDAYEQKAEKQADEFVAKVSFVLSTQNTYSFTVHAPAGSTVTAGVLKNAYYYNRDVMKSVATTDENGVHTTFTIRESDADRVVVFFRVQNPDGVTYWDFCDTTVKGLAAGEGWNFSAQKGNDITVTAEMLHIGDSTRTKDTLYHFENNVDDRADIYLNINGQGYKNMTVGETFGLNVFRNWQAIDSFANAYIAIPDAHYQVLDANGQPSDVVSVVPDEWNTCMATLTANKPGTAIVLVTYDAMESPQSYSSTDNHMFSAIWPECTGVFVVTVDEDGTGIQTNMFMDRLDSVISKESEKNIDAEFDFLFYLGDEGAEYSFKPEDGCTVTVARSTVDEKMSFNGFTSDGVSVAADGTVTVSGLTTGRHVIRVEKGGVANYQVVTARQVTLTLLDKDGNELPMDTEFRPGDTVTLQFWGLLSPKEKMATIYNNNFTMYFKGIDGTTFRNYEEGELFGGMYGFSGTPEAQRVDITIPENWTGDTYSLKGAIYLGGFAGGAGHRDVKYQVGRPPVFDADSVSGMLTRMPAVTLRVQNTKLEDIYQTTGDYISGLGTPDVGSIGGEWMTLGLARSGRTVPDGYYDAVVEYVKANADANERLHRAKSTDNSRIILALTAIGKDVTNVGGHDLLKGLDSMDYIQKQGINGPIWALIALDSHNYPTSGDVTREKLVQTILDAALENGGWTLSGTAADVDMTAMAIQALAPYYKTNEAVKAAVDKALDVLSNAQLSDGGFGSWGSENSESSAQVIVALTALGIDPATDSRFVKDGKTVLDALASYFVDGGGFRHIASGDRDGMATEQGYYALTAYARFLSSFTRLYDMTDVEIKKDSEPTVPTEPSKPTEPEETKPGESKPTEPSKGDNGKNDGKNPNTGDPQTVVLWICAAGVSAICAAAAYLGTKKRKA